MTFVPPRLGPGAIYLRSLDSLFRSHADLLRVAEIEPQSLWTRPTAVDAPARGSPVELRRLSLVEQELLLHGVGYPIGGTICDQTGHISEFCRWAEELEAPWCSEHLSILHVPAASGAHSCGFLMPPLQTDWQVDLVAGNIRKRATAIGKPFAFETGVNYFAPRACEMPDGEFFAMIAEAADCGILLDLTNLWVNDRNGRACLSDVLAQLPLDRVWEIHLAGIEYAHGFWLDAHSCTIDRDLVHITEELVGSLPNLGAIIFELAPDRTSSFGEAAFLGEIEILNRLWETAPSVMKSTETRASGSRTSGPSPDPTEWEKLVANQMLPPREWHEIVDTIEIRIEDDRSFALYRQLAASFRSGPIAELLENTTRLLRIGLGEQPLRELIELYISATLPSAYATDEALAFRDFLEANPVPLPGLMEMLSFESALIEAAADNRTIRLTLTKSLETMLTDLAVGRMPGASSDCVPTMVEIGVDPEPFVRELAPDPL